jgi:hypothetical protein
MVGDTPGRFESGPLPVIRSRPLHLGTPGGNGRDLVGTRTHANPDAGSDARADPGPHADPGSDPDATANRQPNPEIDAHADPTPHADPERDAHADPTPHAEPHAQPERDAKPERDARPERDAHPEPEPDHDPWPCAGFDDVNARSATGRRAAVDRRPGRVPLKPHPGLHRGRRHESRRIDTLGRFTI